MRKKEGMDFDVIVLGAGPSGSTAAMYLGKALGKERVLLVDKAEFPRDKVCGDAQGRKAANIMKELGIYEGYEQLEGQKIYGITLSSPNGTLVHLDVESRNKPAPGYVHKRKIFDNFLFNCAKRFATVKTLTVTDLLMEKDKVTGVKGRNAKGELEEYRCRILLAADGANSMVAQKFGLNKNPPEHFIVATRQYYKGITGMSDRTEMHFVKSLIPGYFWIFPLPNNEANVGLGMIVKDMNERKINLRAAMLKEIKENPLFVERFRNAQPIEEVKGWNLPLASYHRKCYGNGFLLLGDAASLIDPLSGEGVGTSMISSRLASQVALEAIQKNDFSEKMLKKYDKLLWDTIGDEIKANHRLQKLGKRFPHLIDKLLVKAREDEKFRKELEDMLPYTGGRKKMGSSSFLKMLRAF
jgi:geranylgeranyl reductase family protein